MVKYTNLGFTDEERDQITALLRSWQSAAHDPRGRAFTLTDAGEPISWPEGKEWNQEYYLSVLARRGNYTLCLDSGHGMLFLMDTSTGATVNGHDILVLNNAVALDAECFSLEEFYIYLR